MNNVTKTITNIVHAIKGFLGERSLDAGLRGGRLHSAPEVISLRAGYSTTLSPAELVLIEGYTSDNDYMRMLRLS